MPAKTPEERRRIASNAAHVSWANTEDRAARTAKARAAARAAREQKFLDAAGGDPVLAASLRQDYYARIMAKARQARRARRESL